MRQIFFLFTILSFALAFQADKAFAYTEAEFQAWLAQTKQQAIRDGVSPQTAEMAFQTIEFIPRVIELDRKQPEGRLTYAQYRERVLSDFRIQKGREMYQKHRALLEEVSAKFGVQPRYIVALWGIETSYGGYTGNFDIIDALATLGYEGRRGTFFTAELIKALKIVDQGHISLDEIEGSWAGAMGQNQFMPSSFEQYAVDFNGDGRRDIWGSLPDVFASSANYLAQNGWKGDERWGRAVRVPDNVPEAMTGRDTKLPLSEWRNMGVTTMSDAPIPVVEGMQASLIAPDGLDSQSYLVYNNYNVLMRWNRSIYFATTVGLLADAIIR